MDDAILDVCDHAGLWKQQGHRVEVVNVFTRFGNGLVTKGIKTHAGKELWSPLFLEKRRKSEDKQGMRLLGVEFQHLEFTDGGFRVQRGEPIYPSSKQLFSGEVSYKDNKITHELRKVFLRFRTAQRVVVPLGVGGHADHVLVRDAAEKTVPKNILGYYADYPYAQKIASWKIQQVLKAIGRRIHVLPMSTTKKKILTVYASQIPLLFPHALPQYKEILFLSG